MKAFSYALPATGLPYRLRGIVFCALLTSVAAHADQPRFNGQLDGPLIPAFMSAGADVEAPSGAVTGLTAEDCSADERVIRLVSRIRGAVERIKEAVRHDRETAGDSAAATAGSTGPQFRLTDIQIQSFAMGPVATSAGSASSPDAATCVYDLDSSASPGSFESVGESRRRLRWVALRPGGAAAAGRVDSFDQYVIMLKDPVASTAGTSSVPRSGASIVVVGGPIVGAALDQQLPGFRPWIIPMGMTAIVGAASDRHQEWPALPIEDVFSIQAAPCDPSLALAGERVGAHIIGVHTGLDPQATGSDGVNDPISVADAETEAATARERLYVGWLMWSSPTDPALDAEADSPDRVVVINSDLVAHVGFVIPFGEKSPRLSAVGDMTASTPSGHRVWRCQNRSIQTPGSSLDDGTAISRNGKQAIQMFGPAQRGVTIAVADCLSDEALAAETASAEAGISETTEQDAKKYPDELLLVDLNTMRIYWGASYFTEQDGTWHQTIEWDGGESIQPQSAEPAGDAAAAGLRSAVPILIVLDGADAGSAQETSDHTLLFFRGGYARSDSGRAAGLLACPDTPLVPAHELTHLVQQNPEMAMTVAAPPGLGETPPVLILMLVDEMEAAKVGALTKSQLASFLDSNL